MDTGLDLPKGWVVDKEQATITTLTRLFRALADGQVVMLEHMTDPICIHGNLKQLCMLTMAGTWSTLEYYIPPIVSAELRGVILKKAPWYDTLSTDKPTLCWVANGPNKADDKIERVLVAIVSKDPFGNYVTKDYIKYTQAIPLTNEEIERLKR